MGATSGPGSGPGVEGRGRLYVVATPIGNLEDITLRALEVLRRVDVLACEDTRHTRKLLDRHGIDTRTRSCHRFNEKHRSEEILELLSGGRSVALVTDAGTPGVSDPGAELVARAADAGFEVIPIPGPSAPATLLSVAGFAENRHLFVGFAPHRAGERRRWLDDLAWRTETLVMLEAPTRIVATLADLVERFGASRRVVVGRELTKLHEEILRGTLEDVSRRIREGTIKGEFTLVVEGATGSPATLPEGSLAEQVHRVEERLGLARKEAMSYVARERGVPRREVYAALLRE